MREQLRYFLLLGLIILFSLTASPVEGSPAVKTILLPPLKMVELQELLQPFIKAEKMTYSIIQGPQPQLILVGEEAAMKGSASRPTSMRAISAFFRSMAYRSGVLPAGSLTSLSAPSTMSISAIWASPRITAWCRG